MLTNVLKKKINSAGAILTFRMIFTVGKKFTSLQTANTEVMHYLHFHFWCFQEDLNGQRSPTRSLHRADMAKCLSIDMISLRKVQLAIGAGSVKLKNCIQTTSCNTKWWPKSQEISTFWVFLKTKIQITSIFQPTNSHFKIAQGLKRPRSDKRQQLLEVLTGADVVRLAAFGSWPLTLCAWPVGWTSERIQLGQES